jgi:hypothetical protein
MAIHFSDDMEAAAGRSSEAIEALCDLLAQQRDDAIVNPRDLSSLILLTMVPMREYLNRAGGRRPPCNDGD